MALSKIDPDGLNVGQIGGRRNLIINGAMQVDQRGETFTDADKDASGAFLADRFSFQFQDGSSSTRVDTTNTAVTDHPEGFRNASKVVCSTVDDESDDTSVYAYIYGRPLEKQDVAHLEWGTSDAKQVTMSFWVKSGVTGTYILTTLHNNGSNYVKYHKSYTIDSADTWEKKTITIDGAGTGLNWDTSSDNTSGIYFQWWLACTDDRIDTTLDSWFEDTVNSQGARSATGQVNFFLTADAEFLLTGVQLEVGDTATPFEHRSYGEELALCQRYFQRVGSTSGDTMPPIYATRNTTNQALLGYSAVQCFRATPDVSMSGSFTLYGEGSGQSLGSVAANIANQRDGRQAVWTQTCTNIPAGASKVCYGSSGAYFDFNAEL